MTYRFTASLWLWPGEAAWHFISLPVSIAEEIRFLRPRRGPGWGSVKVTAAIGGTRWRTSIFPDKKSGTYLLPVKAEIRRKERLEAGREVEVGLEFAGG